MLLTYDGTDFCGWQRQADHEGAPDRPSVQETVEKGLSEILRAPIAVSASGRTDAGVHAVGQVIHFQVQGGRSLPKDLCWALRSKLPHSISPLRAWVVPEDFHATTSALRKTYRYWIWNSPRPPALLHRYSWWLRRRLDLNELNRMASQIVGTHDFASFRSVGTPVRHTVRRVERAVWKARSPSLLEFEITGNGFLKQMVRNIVGTQVELWMKGRPVEEISRILQALDRRAAGPAAPAQGLFLLKVEYPQHLDKNSQPI